MENLIIGIVATILSTVIIGLWGALIIGPYNSQREIYKKVLRLIRNYEDPRKFQGQLLPKSIMVDCIKEQIENIKEIIDLMSEQKDLNKFLYWLFNYERTIDKLSILFEYIRNPVMLKDQKKFTDDYILDSEKFFKKLKRDSKLPVGKIILLFFIPTILLIAIVITTIFLVK